MTRQLIQWLYGEFPGIADNIRDFETAVEAAQAKIEASEFDSSIPNVPELHDVLHSAQHTMEDWQTNTLPEAQTCECIDDWTAEINNLL